MPERKQITEQRESKIQSGTKPTKNVPRVATTSAIGLEDER